MFYTFHAFLPSEPPTSNTLNQYKFSVLFIEGNATSKHSDASKHGKEGNASKHMTFQYLSENLAYYAPTMLILKPKLQYSFSILPIKSVQVY